MRAKTISTDRWQRLKTLFHAALERAPGDRAAFLTAACGDDAELRAEVERLLHAVITAASPMNWARLDQSIWR